MYLTLVNFMKVNVLRGLRLLNKEKSIPLGVIDSPPKCKWRAWCVSTCNHDQLRVIKRCEGIVAANVCMPLLVRPHN